MSDDQDTLDGDDGTPDLDEMTFEEALEELQGIVDELERGDLGLEASMEAFERGNRLAEVCRARLDEAEGKLEELLDSGEQVDFEVEEAEEG